MVVLDLKTNSKDSLPKQTAPLAANGEVPTIHPTGPATTPAGGVELAAAILDSIREHIFTAEAYSDLNEQLRKLGARVRTEVEQEGLRTCGAEVNSVLEAFKNRTSESSLETAVNFQKVLSLVNESFSCIQAGDSKADKRLKYFEKSLSEAARMESLLSLRRHLSGMLDFVREESKGDLIEKDTKLKAITEKMREVHAVHGQLRIELPGRVEALDHIKKAIEEAKGKPEGSVSVFVIDSLKTLRTRHGDGVASSILDELARKQVKPLAPDGKLYSWNSSSVVLISQPKEPGAPTTANVAIPSIFEHRAFVGTRMATFKVDVRSISIALARGLDPIRTTLDAFCKDHAS